MLDQNDKVIAKFNLDVISKNKNISDIIIAATWYKDKYYSPEGIVIDPNQLHLATELIYLKHEIEKNTKRVFMIGSILMPGKI